MTDRYCVLGNPIAHSKSPRIHAAFAAATGQDLSYTTRLAALDAFPQSVADFSAGGGKGANVTVPFKEAAFRLSTQLSARAARAGAVNTLLFKGTEILGDNTDGAGLVRDIMHNLDFPLADQRILLLGAGGAARGVIAPLLAAQPKSLLISNRNQARAQALAESFADLFPIDVCSFNELADKKFDLVINATAASLAGATLPLPPGIFATDSLAYDMMYAPGATPFLAQAGADGAARLSDGLGMLVEQAAEAFFLWRGIRPPTVELLAELRAGMAT